MKRLLRIYPTYILAVVICLIVKLIVFQTVSQPQLLKSLSLLPFGNIPYVLNVEWTLIYEVFFYFICFPFTIRCLKRYFPYFVGLWSVVIIIAGGWFEIPTLFLPTIKTIFFSYFNLCFIAGILVYYIYKHYQLQSKIGNSILLVLSGAIIMVFEEMGKSITVIADTKYIAFAICMGIIIYASLELLKDCNSKSLNILERFGEYSYALYLVHVPIISITFVAVKDILHLKLDTITGIVVLIVSLVIGYLYGKVDIKLHKLVRNRMQYLMKKFEKIVMSFSIIVILGVTVIFMYKAYQEGNFIKQSGNSIVSNKSGLEVSTPSKEQTTEIIVDKEKLDTIVEILKVENQDLIPEGINNSPNYGEKIDLDEAQNVTTQMKIQGNFDAVVQLESELYGVSGWGVSVEKSIEYVVLVDQDEKVIGIGAYGILRKGLTEALNSGENIDASGWGGYIIPLQTSQQIFALGKVKDETTYVILGNINLQ